MEGRQPSSRRPDLRSFLKTTPCPVSSFATSKHHLMSRPPVFAAPHKALRACFCTTLTRASSTDHTQAEQVLQLLAQCRELFNLLHVHVTEENNVTLTRLDERAPGSGEHDRNDHEELELTQATLEGQLADLEQEGATAERLERLYDGLGKLFGMHLEHMHGEETVTQNMLWDHFTDEELNAMRVTIMKQMSFDQMLTWFKYMFPAMRPQERVGMLTGFLASAPPPLAEKATEVIHSVLGDAEWERTQALLVPAN